MERRGYFAKDTLRFQREAALLQRIFTGHVLAHQFVAFSGYQSEGFKSALSCP